MPTYSTVINLFVAASGDVSVNSPDVNLSTLDTACFEFLATGTLVGVAKIQACNDLALGYKDTSLSYAVNVGTGLDKALFDLPIGFGFKYARLAWVRTSGTGTISANANKKDNA